MARFAKAKTYTEDEIKSWGDPKTWGQGKSPGPLTDALLTAYLAMSAGAALVKGGDDGAVWDTCMSVLSDYVSGYDGDNKTIYLEFRSCDWGGLAFGTNVQNSAGASVVFGRYWIATVSWT